MRISFKLACAMLFTVGLMKPVLAGGVECRISLEMLKKIILQSTDVEKEISMLGNVLEEREAPLINESAVDESYDIFKVPRHVKKLADGSYAAVYAADEIRHLLSSTYSFFRESDSKLITQRDEAHREILLSARSGLGNIRSEFYSIADGLNFTKQMLTTCVNNDSKELSEDPEEQRKDEESTPKKPYVSRRPRLDRDLLRDALTHEDLEILRSVGIED
ncbi:MAG: hypothetical protein HYS98_01485 [Deltaproteobacteria bacterium]|nr:hypothetical protein [Deltaproteobacteria bacterium]